VEKQENFAGFCSGCSGDYEDPDLTAWEEDSDTEEPEHGQEESLLGTPWGKLTRPGTAHHDHCRPPQCRLLFRR